MGEQPLVGGFAQGEVEQHVLLADVETDGEVLDVLQHERGLAGRAERKPDVGGAEHLAGQCPEPGADLGAEHRADGLAEHPHDRRGHRLRLAAGERVADAGHRRLGDRLDQPLPPVERPDEPLGAAPRGRGLHPGRELRGLVQPQVGEPDRVGDLLLLLLRGGRVLLLRHGAAGHVESGVPVQGAVVRLHHRLDLPEQRAEVGHAGPAGTALTEQGAEVAAHVGEELLEGRALERVVVPVGNVVTRVVRHASTVRRAPSHP